MRDDPTRANYLDLRNQNTALIPDDWRQEETSRKSRTVRQPPGQIMVAPFNMNPLSLAHLHGQSVLVKSAQDRHDPSIALRGSLDTMTVPGIVKVVLQYPDMCIAPAHQGIINLDARTVDRLLKEGPEGPYTITVQESIDPEKPVSTPPAAS